MQFPHVHRYGDYIQTKSEAELVLMLGNLIEELSLVGPNLNSTKIKILRYGGNFAWQGSGQIFG